MFICIFIMKCHVRTLCFVYCCCICILCNYLLQLYSKQNAVICGEQNQNPSTTTKTTGASIESEWNLIDTKSPANT